MSDFVEIVNSEGTHLIRKDNIKAVLYRGEATVLYLFDGDNIITATTSYESIRQNLMETTNV